MKNILKRILKWSGILIGVIILLGVIWLNTSPQFGGSHEDEDLVRYAESSQYNGEIFVNKTETKMDMSPSKMWDIMGEFMKDDPARQPDFELPIVMQTSSSLEQAERQTRLMWYGHSAFLLQIDGMNILLDPMLGKVAAPHEWLGEPRYSEKLPIEISELPKINAIFISHDHYDHLDYPSIMELADKTEDFFVPLGVGAHLRDWGIEESRIHEMDWWNETNYKSLKLAFTPSRHFSGRGLSDRAKTLWGSWVIKGTKHNLYFSGDGGYADHFKQIGDKYGPFDFAMMECGQYNERWSAIHMMPEQTAQAAVDLKAKMMMPIHWGAFTLALHSWTDPIVRVKKKAKELNQPLSHPKIGEFINLDQNTFPTPIWWER